jgi:hypothetical protein
VTEKLTLPQAYLLRLIVSAPGGVDRDRITVLRRHALAYQTLLELGLIKEQERRSRIGLGRKLTIAKPTKLGKTVMDEEFRTRTVICFEGEEFELKPC